VLKCWGNLFNHGVSRPIHNGRGSMRSSSTCRNTLISSLPFLLSIIPAIRSATVVSYNENQVWNYLQRLPRENVSSNCANSLDRVETYLTDRSTLEEEREFFYASYGTGDATQFTSRDQDRWIYRAFECLKAAGETSYSASQYPLHYCYGFNGDKRETAYGICIPSVCANDRQLVGFPL
jgi:hypothetical protein